MAGCSTTRAASGVWSEMRDERLRPLKDRVLGPIAFGSPMMWTALAFVLGLACAVTAALGLTIPSIALWLLSRIADGLDGVAARHRNRVTDLGGYLDIVGDVVIYAAVPFGIAWRAEERSAWIAVAVMIATFYVNAVSWTYLAALAVKRGERAATSLPMPSGLIEGAETVAAYVVFLALPHLAPWLFAAFAALVAVTVAQRITWASRHL
jgi:phosphatidylglycerophosphate synthase